MLTFMVRLALFIALSIMGAGPTDAIVVSISGAIAGISVRRLHNRGKTGYYLLIYYGIPSWIMKNAGLDAAGFMGWPRFFLALPLPVEPVLARSQLAC